MSPVRAGAALGMLVTAGAIYGLAATSAFGYSPTALRIEGAAITPDGVIRERLALEPGQNIFQIASAPLEAAVLEIPAIAAVEISVGLPDTVVVDVKERRPILVWQAGDRAYLVDASGLLFAERGDPAPAVVTDLPVVNDERSASRSLDVSDTIEALDLDAASRLGSLTPSQLGSAAGGLRLGLSDENGFALHSVPEGWTAIFGRYVHGLRPPEMIPSQVLALTKLFAEVGESNVATAILADDREGTYIPRATPAPSVTPKP